MAMGPLGGKVMDQDNDWLEVISNLLQHFDDNEGTTYLYDRAARREFVEYVPERIRAKVERLLNDYHGA